MTAGDSGFQLCSIDFDNDGMREYSYRWDDWGPQGWFMHLVPGNFNSAIALKGTTTNAFGGRFVKSFSSNETIGNTETWGSSQPEPFIGESTTDSNFLGLGDKYIGVRFIKNGVNYYGWILVNFSQTGNARSLTVKSYAYNSTANQSILAGQGSNLSVNETKAAENFKIYPNPVKKSFTIEHTIKSGDIKYEIYNTLGQIVKTDVLHSKEKQIHVSELDKGVYYIKLYDKAGTLGQQKFIKD
ncbi:hypothetical protein ACM46_18365 [Chryseobacterium angstadtii]|uniref:Secretion system C-terminal sorting domain-containing protein n=2 Tax=Chryseobacterium angstadtii TaxID=558151 RepID=A0A0J7I345_9FLAO|nr:hypothetical protein ACM46_18365 [Chryseobacterium angstadtii]